MMSKDIKLRISLFQMDISWEDKAQNLDKVEACARSLKGKTDLLVLPEMFSTGFSMSPETLAETNEGTTISRLKKISGECDLALAGSFIAQSGESYFNRGFFVTTDQTHFIDKKHLFRMGEEAKHYTAGSDQKVIIYKGFNISLFICYDLRFPVWSSNYNNKYDLALYVACWPEQRRIAWNTLLDARAIENSAYVCGVNRSGTDAMNLKYSGDSKLVDPKGSVLAACQKSIEDVVTYELDLYTLEEYRRKFPVWKDADDFRIL